MTTTISTLNAQHYTWGDACDGWHLVRDERLSIIEERMPPGSSEQRHLHTQARQFFYVLAGELTMELAGQTHRLAAGQGIEVAPGAAHQATNQSQADTRFLVISSPPAQGDRTPC